MNSMKLRSQAKNHRVRFGLTMEVKQQQNWTKQGVQACQNTCLLRNIMLRYAKNSGCLICSLTS